LKNNKRVIFQILLILTSKFEAFILKWIGRFGGKKHNKRFREITRKIKNSYKENY